MKITKKKTTSPRRITRSTRPSTCSRGSRSCSRASRATESVRGAWPALIGGVCLWLAAGSAAAEDAFIPAPPVPRIALVIDDLGNSLDTGSQALGLHGVLNFSFLPHTPYSARLATQAHRAGAEVLLHLPMASEHHRALGPGGLVPGMSRAEQDISIAASLASIPYVSGVNNHMGSLLTQLPEAMQWTMEALRLNGAQYFLDSRTTTGTVAEESAISAGLPALHRDVFLDHDPDTASIEAQFDRLIRKAEQSGRAVGIGHPYPETLAVLKRRLPELERRGIRLVKLSQLLKGNESGEPSPWLASSSPSPKAAKNSKPSPPSTCCAAQGSAL